MARRRLRGGEHMVVGARGRAEPLRCRRGQRNCALSLADADADADAGARRAEHGRDRGDRRGLCAPSPARDRARLVVLSPSGAAAPCRNSPLLTFFGVTGSLYIRDLNCSLSCIQLSCVYHIAAMRHCSTHRSRRFIMRRRRRALVTFVFFPVARIAQRARFLSVRTTSVFCARR
jgi:hypothetical protein